MAFDGGYCLGGETYSDMEVAISLLWHDCGHCVCGKMLALVVLVGHCVAR